MPRSRKNMKKRTMRNGQRGGSAANSAPVAMDNSDSAWKSVMNAVGNLPTQIQNALMINTNQGPVAAASTQLVPISNPNANVPNVYKGGRRKSRGRRGGLIGVGAVLEQAVVPLGLFGLQNAYSKRRQNRAQSRHRRK